MNFENFLKESASSGTFHSEGAFSVDLSKATEKVAAFALPSDSHYLLKGVQVANRLGAELIAVTIGRYGNLLRFECSEPGVTGDFQTLHSAVADPLNVDDPLLQDLIGLLYGTIKDGIRETTWTCRRGGKAETLAIDSARKVRTTREDHETPDSELAVLELKVTHSKPWKFWTHARRRLESAALLRERCGFSPARVVIDGWQMDTSNASILNTLTDYEHLEPGSFGRRIPASNILFSLAQDGQPRFALQRPSMSAYLVRKDVMNVWATGMRVRNTMSPDGVSTAAWMLQFRRDNENISMRWVHKRDFYQAAVAFNFRNKRSVGAPRLMVVRAGVLLSDEEIVNDELRKLFRGCTILLADDTLETDLTGFQLVRNQALWDTIRSLESLFEPALEYYAVGAEMMRISEIVPEVLMPGLSTS